MKNLNTDYPQNLTDHFYHIFRIKILLTLAKLPGNNYRNFIILCCRSNKGRRRDDMPPPMAVRSKNCGGSMSICGGVCSTYISGGWQWLSCRQPACLLPRQLHRGTDRQTDRDIPKSPPPAAGWGHNNLHRLNTSLPHVKQQQTVQHAC